MGEILRVDRNERMRGRLQINGNLRKKTGVTDVFLQENLEMSKICSLNVSFQQFLKEKYKQSCSLMEKLSKHYKSKKL